MNYAVSLADPSGSSAIVAALTWVQATLLGTVAETLAIIAVASIGFRMLAGRTDIRKGATIICGCFLILGAASIAAGLRSMADGLAGGQTAASSTDAPPAIQVTASPPGDPYAGASIIR